MTRGENMDIDFLQLALMYALFFSFAFLGAGIAHLITMAVRKFRGRQSGGTDRWNAD
nr:MAG TPA: hypothetical protein [Caudoviricetes sp.]